MDFIKTKTCKWVSVVILLFFGVIIAGSIYSLGSSKSIQFECPEIKACPVTEVKPEIVEKEVIKEVEVFVGTSERENCKLHFSEYLSSELELKWLENIRSWTKKPCEEALKQKEEILKYLSITTKIFEGKMTFKDIPKDLKLFSMMRYRRECTHTKKNIPVEDQFVDFPIEPLVGILRDPRGVCKGFPKKHVTNLEYMVLGQPLLENQKLRLFDYGALLWVAGSISQDWFWKYYHEAGFKIINMQLWEAKKIDPVKLISAVPEDAIPVYQYFNTPISADSESKLNPWKIIKSYEKEDVYFAVKLDIDTPTIELPLVNQLVEDEMLPTFINEFFFEHHTHIPSMSYWWGKKVSGTVADTYDIFFNLRKKGIRAHSWP